MWSDIFTLALAILGIIFLLLSAIIHITAWQTKKFTITLPIYECDRTIFNQIYNLRSLLDFCGLKKKCTVVIINYGAPEWFCNEILSYYEKYNFLRIISYLETEDKLF